MADVAPYTAAIADIGETLISLLKQRLADVVTPDSIILYSPGEIESSDSPRLCLFLYLIAENPQMKNRVITRVDDSRLQQPGLILDLYYMLVPYEASKIQDRTDRTKEEHALLGRAMQVLNDNSILRDPHLKGGLAGRGLEIKVLLNAVALDEMTKIWDAFQTRPFKPSVCYIVTPVEIESSIVTTVSRVVEAALDYSRK